MADLSSALIGLDLLVEATASPPIDVAALVGFRGIAEIESPPSAVGNLSFLADACAEVEGSRTVRALAAAVDLPWDANADGRVDEVERERDYVFVTHPTGGLLVFDLTQRSDPHLVARIRLPLLALGVAIERTLMRAYVSGASGGLAIVDLAALATTTLVDADVNGADDRVLEVVPIPAIQPSNPFLHNFKPSGSVGRNLFLGELAGNFTMTSSGSTSSNIVAIGYQAGNSNTTGFDYVAVGVGALQNNTEGVDNTAIGNYSMNGLTTGTDNTAVGYAALGNGTVTGSANSAVGYNALRSVAGGSFNIGVGEAVLNDVTSGTYNTAIGYTSGDGITTGSNNTIIGARVIALTSSLANTVILADGGGSQRLRFNSSGAMSFDAGSTFGTSGYFLTSTGSGSAPAWSNTLPSGTTLPISSLTAATGANTIDNTNYTQEWQWNSLAGGNGLVLSTSSTAAPIGANGNGLLKLNLTGANSTASATSFGNHAKNTHKGTTSTNISGYFW